MAARILDAATITFYQSGPVTCCITCEDGTSSGSLVWKSIGLLENTVSAILGWAASALSAALVASLHLTWAFAPASL